MNILEHLKSQKPSSSPLTDPLLIQKKYKYWRTRILSSIFIGYAIFYFVRNNLPASMPALMKDLHFTKTQTGWILSALAFSYGVSKFFNGILADRANPRYFMAIGLGVSALMNIFFGLSSSFWALSLFWILNGWFQGMGATPCTRSLVYWFSFKERGTYWGIWNAAHQVGGALVLLLAGWLATTYGWRSSFFVPAIIGFLGVIFLLVFLRDTPASLGLPSIESFKETELSNDLPSSVPAKGMKEVLLGSVLKNRHIWFLGVGNFFVYIVRYGAITWAPTFLVEMKGADLSNASLKTSSFEFAGILGAFLAGMVSDRFFKGSRGPVNVLCMLLSLVGLFVFWKTPAGHPFVDILSLSAVGFLIYGPQMLVGVAAADLAGKEAAAASNGFTGLLGYIGSVLAGVGVGSIVDHYGWGGGFMFIISCAILGMFCFLMTWSAKAQNH